MLSKLHLFWDIDNVAVPKQRPVTALDMYACIVDWFISEKIVKNRALITTSVFFVDSGTPFQLSDGDKGKLRNLNCTMVQCTRRKEDADRQITSKIDELLEMTREERAKPNAPPLRIGIISSDKDFNVTIQKAVTLGADVYVVHNAEAGSQHEKALEFYATNTFRLPPEMILPSAFAAVAQQQPQESAPVPAAPALEVVAQSPTAVTARSPVTTTTTPTQKMFYIDGARVPAHHLVENKGLEYMRKNPGAQGRWCKGHSSQFTDSTCTFCHRKPDSEIVEPESPVKVEVPAPQDGRASYAAMARPGNPTEGTTRPSNTEEVLPPARGTVIVDGKATNVEDLVMNQGLRYLLEHPGAKGKVCYGNHAPGVTTSNCRFIHFGAPQREVPEDAPFDLVAPMNPRALVRVETRRIPICFLEENKASNYLALNPEKTGKICAGHPSGVSVKECRFVHLRSVVVDNKHTSVFDLQQTEGLMRLLQFPHLVGKSCSGHPASIDLIDCDFIHFWRQ